MTSTDDTFRFRGRTFPLLVQKCSLWLYTKHTPGDKINSTIIVNMAADLTDLANSVDKTQVLASGCSLNTLNGFVGFDVPNEQIALPIDWKDLVGTSIEESLDDDGDINVYVGYHLFAESQSLQILERDETRFLVETQWQVPDEGVGPVVARGWVPFGGISVSVSDKVFGARIRDLPKDEVGTTNPGESLDQLTRDIDADARRMLAELVTPDSVPDFVTSEAPKWHLRYFKL